MHPQNHSRLFKAVFFAASVFIFFFIPYTLKALETTGAPENSVDFYPSALINGGFDQDADLNNIPDGWSCKGKCRRRQDEAGNWELVLTGEKNEFNPAASQVIGIPKNLNAGMTLAARVRGKDILPADEGSDGEAGVTVIFLNSSGRPLGTNQQMPKWQPWKGKFSWRPWSWQIRVPPEAASAELRLELRGAAGKAIFDDVEVLWDFPEDHARHNFIADGGFEYLNSFSSWQLPPGSQARYPGRNGRARLFIQTPGDKLAAKQQIFFKKGAVKNARLEFDYQIESNATAGGPFIRIEYLNGKGRTIETFQPPRLSAPILTWQHLSLSISIPQETRSALVFFGAEGVQAAVSFDNVRLTAAAKNGSLLRPLSSTNDTKDWQPFEPAAKLPEGALDASDLLDAPAGQLGAVETREDGHFYFANGKRARFFGINLQGPQALPSHADAALFAGKLSRMGFNLVRLHHMDAPWSKPNLFSPEAGDTQHFSEDSLDRLDYFIAELKKRGIYIYLDLLVSRKFRSGDQVVSYQNLERGAKITGMFNPRLIELQKKFAEDLLTHTNLYTQTRLADEPAIALIDIANENSLLRLSRRKIEDLPVYYRDELQNLWNEYLTQHPAKDLNAESFLTPDDARVQAFYAELQRNYFRDMQRFIRSLGVKAPIAGSNLGYDGLDLAVNSELDYVDRHAYWDHPMGGYGDLVRFNNGLLINEVEPEQLLYEPKRINPIAKLARLKIQGKPFVAGEWNINWPNEYRAIGPMLMAAYACLQDWDAIIQFNFEGRDARVIEGNFDISSKPEIFLQMPAAARLFLEQHVSPAKERAEFPLLGDSQPVYALAFIAGIERLAQGKPKHQPVRLFDEARLAADNGQLVWNKQAGIVRIEAPKTQAVMGRLGGVAQKLPDLHITLTPTFAVAVLSSLDQEEIPASKRLLLSTAARAENRGTVYNAARTVLRSSGAGPVLMEPIAGQAVLIRKDGAVPRVYALAPDGSHKEEMEVGAESNHFAFNLGSAYNYEIIYDNPS